MKYRFSILTIMMLCCVSTLTSQVTIDPDRIGIGVSPVRAFHILSTGGIGDDIILESTGTGAGQLNFWRSSGTPNAKTAESDVNSRIGEISWRGYNGSSYRVLGDINVTETGPQTRWASEV